MIAVFKIMMQNQKHCFEKWRSVAYHGIVNVTTTTIIVIVVFVVIVTTPIVVVMVIITSSPWKQAYGQGNADDGKYEGEDETGKV